MAFMVHLENGSLKNYTPVYPGGMVHPSQPAPGGLGGKMYLHDCLWDGVDVGTEYAKDQRKNCPEGGTEKDYRVLLKIKANTERLNISNYSSPFFLHPPYSSKLSKIFTKPHNEQRQRSPSLVKKIVVTGTRSS